MQIFFVVVAVLWIHVHCLLSLVTTVQQCGHQQASPKHVSAYSLRREPWKCLVIWGKVQGFSSMCLNGFSGYFSSVYIVQGNLISKIWPSKSAKWIILTQIFKSGAALMSFAMGLSWLPRSSKLSFKAASGASDLAYMSVRSSALGAQKMSLA